MCFSLSGVESFLLWLVAVCFIVGFLRILVPWILSLAGVGIDPTASRLINLAILAIIIIAVIIAVFWLLECALGGGGMGFRIR